MVSKTTLTLPSGKSLLVNEEKIQNTNFYARAGLIQNFILLLGNFKLSNTFSSQDIQLPLLKLFLHRTILKFYYPIPVSMKAVENISNAV